MNDSLKRIVFIIISSVLIIAGGFFVLLYLNAPSPPADNPVIEQPESELPEEPPEIPGGPVIMSRFVEYYEKNEDMIGWIRVPNTAINYPVVYCSDNAYYLSHDFLKEPSKAGVPFLDMGADILKKNQSLSLYGHYLTSGKMFTSLHKYKSLAYYQEFPLFEFSTIYEDGFYKIFSVFYMAGNRTDKLFYYYPVSNFGSDEAFMKHVDEIRTRSIFNTTVDVIPGDRLLLMTCCTYETNNLRLIVAGRKIRPGESIIVDTENATLNPTPLYPQKWYDAKGGAPPLAADS